MDFVSAAINKLTNFDCDICYLIFDINIGIDLMDESHKKIEKKCPLLPFENQVGLSTFDLNLISRHRKKYVRAFDRKQQISYPSEMMDVLEG